jgi:hypothetical protein
MVCRSHVVVVFRHLRSWLQVCKVIQRFKVQRKEEDKRKKGGAGDGEDTEWFPVEFQRALEIAFTYIV